MELPCRAVTQHLVKAELTVSVSVPRAVGIFSLVPLCLCSSSLRTLNRLSRADTLLLETRAVRDAERIRRIRAVGKVTVASLFVI